MNSHDAIRTSLGLARQILTGYISDLDDAELMQRPTDGANHAKWQLGHLISSENQLLEQIKSGSAPQLPDNFADCYTKETASSDEAEKFHGKDEYLKLLDEQRRASLELLETLSDSDLDQPGPEGMRDFAPTVGAVLVLQGTHDLMHAGQIAVLRRKLNKPVLF